MKILLNKLTKDSDLKTGMQVCYKDTFGEFTLTGTIESTYFDGITLYVVNGAAYAANELKLIAQSEMLKVATANGYDYYYGNDNGNKFYNIVPTGQAAPNGGYNRYWICGIKKVPDMFPMALNSVKVLFADSKYNYETNVSAQTTEITAMQYFVGKRFNVGCYPVEDMQQCIGIEFTDNNL